MFLRFYTAGVFYLAFGLQALGGFLLDQIIGDPAWLPHPVIAMGKAILFLEKPWRKGSPVRQRLGGMGLVILVAGGTYLVGLVAVGGLWAIYPPLGFVISMVLISTTIASQGLARAAMEIFRELAAGRLVEARASLSRIVGRDTGDLSAREVVRGTVETVAENAVDAVLAPLFYAFLGGAPLALAYRAINTMDSMVGYPNAKYSDFGWAAARLDDLANFIPARLGGVLLCLLAPLVKGHWSKAFAVWAKDRYAHPSPNSGQAEAAMAGALGVRLGGLNHYGGIASLRAYLGEERWPLVPGVIPQAVRLLEAAGYVWVTGGLLLAGAGRWAG